MKKSTNQKKRDGRRQKKSRQGLGKFTKYGSHGPQGQSKHYRKRYRGQGK